MSYILHYRYHENQSDLDCGWGDPSFALEQTMNLHRFNQNHAEIIDGALFIRCRQHSATSVCGIMTVEDTDARSSRPKRQKKRRV